MDTPALGSAGLLHAQLACCCLSNLGFGVSSQGWGSSFSPGRGCFHTLSLFLQVLRAVEAPPCLGGKASRSLLTSHHGLMALLPPTLKGQTDIAPVLAQIEAFSPRRHSSCLRLDTAVRRDVCANNLAGESGSWFPQNRALSLQTSLRLRYSQSWDFPPLPQQ